MEYYGHSSLEENGMIIYFPNDIKRHKNGNSSEVFKLTFIYFSSYPLVLALPKDMLDENLKKVARCHKLQRVSDCLALSTCKITFIEWFFVL
ncbi:unnamed protein product [Rotaria socialis]